MTIGSTLYMIVVCVLVGLFFVSLFSFVRTILRNNSQKETSLSRIEKLQREQNELLQELLHSIKEKDK